MSVGIIISTGHQVSQISVAALLVALKNIPVLDAAIPEQAYTKLRSALGSSRKMEAILRIVTEHYARVDEIFRQGVAACPSGIPCKAGCSYCCHYKTDVMPWEVFLLVAYLRKYLTAEQLADVQKRAEANREAIRGMTFDQHVGAQLPCPLLRDGQCIAYKARPDACRTHQSQTIAPCLRAYTHPNDSTNQSDPIPRLRILLTAVGHAADQAFSAAGYDARSYDLSCALVEALTNPKCAKRWRRGKQAFSNASLSTPFGEHDVMAKAMFNPAPQGVTSVKSSI